MGGRGASSGIHINSRISYHGKPNIINVSKSANLNKRQKKLLNNLKNKGDYVKIKKDDVNMKDLSALTAKENVEFSLFTLGSRRIVIRGNAESSSPNTKLSKEILKYHYRLSGHTHIGESSMVLVSSDGDVNTLKKLSQRQSVIYNSVGKFQVFEK